ncbi:MAG TPA: flagellar motor switch protein FliM [Acidimicrobiales bacterium]|nr:flagellar motor switch protein FliM [Acidimicrobiales bacterium]
MPRTAKTSDDRPLEERAREFDFRRPNKLSRDHVRNLQIVHETFARQLTTVFSSTLRAVSNVSVLSIEQLTYDEYVRDTPNPTHLTILSLPPLPGVAILQLPLGVALTIVDLLLGGRGGQAPTERPLTEIESGLVRTILDRALAELVYAYESVVELQPSVVGFESNPQFAQVAGPSDMTVVIILEIKLGGNEYMASICYPDTTLAPVLDTISASSNHAQIGRADADLARRRVADRLLDVPVELHVDFAPAHLRSTEILSLQVGDVLALGQAVDTTLTASVGGMPTFLVRPARSGKRLACQIVSPVSDWSRFAPEGD